MNCCDILYINGYKTHEQGCTEAWKDDKRECRWCGQEFTPESSSQTCCDEDCLTSYYGG